MPDSNSPLRPLRKWISARALMRQSRGKADKLVLAEISAFDQSGHRLPFKGARGSSRALFESGKMTVLSLT